MNLLLLSMLTALSCADEIYRANIRIIGSTRDVNTHSGVSPSENTFTFGNLQFPRPSGVQNFRKDIVTAKGPKFLAANSQMNLANITFTTSNPLQEVEWGIGNDVGFSRLRLRPSRFTPQMSAVTTTRYNFDGHGARILIFYDFFPVEHTHAPTTTAPREGSRAAPTFKQQRPNTLGNYGCRETAPTFSILFVCIMFLLL